VNCNLERRIVAVLPAFQTSGECAPPPPCSEDGFESNDGLGQATPVTIGTTSSGTACADNDDVFAVPATGASVTAVLTFNPPTVLDVALLDSTGAELASGSGSSSPLSVTTPRPVTGTVYVRIQSVGNAQGDYTLFLPKPA
jgi:hypothetical protein